MDSLEHNSDPFPEQSLELGMQAAFEVDPSDSQGNQPTPGAERGADYFRGAFMGEEPGTMIGPYKIIERIGEGGFGVIYRAEQEAPLRRTVALKVVKSGMDTEQVIARFEVERQALAMMDHPNIARIFDAGATTRGKPYFVMELVTGSSITKYCDRQQLGTRERVELMVAVCNAVQHAHHKGVIHRDIKSSNVLVSVADGNAVPVLIDFGIAKATEQSLTERTVFTEYSQFVGTPAYMSPEQAEGAGVDVDTRTDVYSLGVLLYELLTGTTPFDSKELISAGYLEARRIIREDDPQRPSTRIRSMGDRLEVIAQRRRTDARRLGKLIRGDLDWIIMKAMEKDRTRRYETPSALADDLMNYLGNRPVTAGPPGFGYRLRKLARRNRAAVVSTVLITLALLCGIIGTTLGMLEAAEQRDEARVARDAEGRERRAAERARQAELELRAVAENEAAHAQVVTSFLADMLALADPSVSLNSDATVRGLLDRASSRVRESFVGQPAAEATIRTTIGRAYRMLGEPELAAPHLRRALKLRGELPDVSRADLYETTESLVKSLRDVASPAYFPLASRSLHLSVEVIRESNPDIAEYFDLMVGAAEAGQIDEAYALLRPSTLLIATELEQGDPSLLIVADALVGIAQNLWYLGRAPQAEFFLDEALMIRRRELPETHPDIGEILSRLVEVHNTFGQFQQAENRINESLEILHNLHPEGHWHIALSESQLAECLVGQGRFAEAEQLLIGSHQAILKARGESSEDLIASLSRFVSLYDHWDRPEDAERYREQLASACAVARLQPSWQIIQLALGPERTDLADTLINLSGVIVGANVDPELREARMAAAFEDFLTQRRRLLADDDPLSALIARLLYRTSQATGDRIPDDVQKSITIEALTILRSWEDVLPADVAGLLAEISKLSIASGDVVEAEQFARESLELTREVYGDDALTTAEAEQLLAQCLLLIGEASESEELLLSANSILKEQLGETSEMARASTLQLYELYRRRGQAEEVRHYALRNLSSLRTLSESAQAEPGMLNDTAWLLLTVEPADLRDPHAALELARRAVSQSKRDDPGMLDTLAFAHYQVGDKTEAERVQTEAVSRLGSEHVSIRAELEARLLMYQQALNDE